MARKKVAETAKSSQRAARKPFLGLWRITWMELWAQEFVDEDVDGFFEFESNGRGSFQFGYVQGQIDYCLSMCDGKPRLEFTWDGYDEMHPTQGRGWVIAEGDQMSGMLFIHLGDESRFTAARFPSTKTGGRTRRRWTNPRSR